MPNSSYAKHIEHLDEKSMPGTFLLLNLEGDVLTLPAKTPNWWPRYPSANKINFFSLLGISEQAAKSDIVNLPQGGEFTSSYKIEHFRECREIRVCFKKIHHPRSKNPTISVLVLEENYGVENKKTITPSPVCTGYDNLKNLLHNLPGGIFQYRFRSNTDYTIEFISKGASELFQRPVEDLRNPFVLYDYLHPEEVQTFFESIHSAYTDLTPWSREARILINGKTKWIRAIATSEKMPDKSVIWNGIITDITAEKEAQMADAANERRQRLLNTTLNEMLHLPDLSSIYHHITHAVSSEYPDCSISFSRVDESGTKSYPVSNQGFDLNKMRELGQTTNFNFLESKYEISDVQYKKYCTGKMIRFENCFEDFVSPDLPHETAVKLNQITSIKNIYGIGITKDSRLFGIILFFVKNKTFAPDPLLTEAFARQSGLIIERKLMELALTESRLQFKTLVENQGEGLAITNPEQKITFVNPMACKILGVPEDKVLNSSLNDYIAKTDIDLVKKETEKRKRGIASTYEITIVQPNGKRVPILATVTPHLDEHGNMKESLGVFRDISEQKKAEKELKLNEEKYRTIIYNASDGISLANEDARIMLVNPAFEKITGYALKEVQNRYIWDINFALAVPEMQTPKVYNALKAQTKALYKSNNPKFANKIIQFDICTKAGEFKTIEARHFMIETSSGTRFGAIFRDITTQKKAELQLKEIDAAKNKLFSIMGHDLRNPMGNISNLSQLLIQNFHKYPQEKAIRYLELIHQAGESSLQLLENLLLWSRTQQGSISVHPTMENLYSIAEETVAIVSSEANSKRINIKNEINKESTAYADKNMIFTVLRNLLSNAIKYTEKGGKIKLRSKNSKASVKLYVIDDGLGMDPEILSGLFQPGGTKSIEGTANEKGTGLGLTICHEFVKANKGKLEVKSSPNEGSTFIIHLPLDKE